MQRQGIDKESDIANVLKYAKELPNLQRYWENIQANNHNLKCQNQELEKDLQARRTNIVELTEVENMLHQNIDTLQNDIDRLLNERLQLQQVVSRFKDGNEKYLQIKSIAEIDIDRLLAERKSLLSSALIAVVEALRMNPDRYAVIYNSKYDNNESLFYSSSTAISSSSLLNLLARRHANNSNCRAVYHNICFSYTQFAIFLSSHYFSGRFQYPRSSISIPFYIIYLA
jgi:chromosome segregation ATPase